METLVFALWMFALAEMPVAVSLNVYDAATDAGIEPAKLAGILSHEHPGGGDNFLPPHDESTTGAVGLFQLKGVWYKWSKEDHGYDLTWEEFATDDRAQTEIAALIVARFEKRHAEHATENGHPELAHWNCGNTGRDLWDAGEETSCQSSVRRLEKRVERVRAWRVFAVPFKAIDYATAAPLLLRSPALQPKEETDS